MTAYGLFLINESLQNASMEQLDSIFGDLNASFTVKLLED